MKNCVMYSQKIRHYSHIFRETVDAYRAAVDFFISVCLKEWDDISMQGSAKAKMNRLEAMTHPTSHRPAVSYCFDAHMGRVRGRKVSRTSEGRACIPLPVQG